MNPLFMIQLQKPYYYAVKESKPSQYFVWKDSDTSVDGLYRLGAFQGNKGDPYTYDKVSGSMYRVISGPKRGPIGKTFRPKTTPKKLPAVEDDQKVLAKATSRDAGPGLEQGMPAGRAAPKSSRILFGVGRKREFCHFRRVFSCFLRCAGSDPQAERGRGEVNLSPKGDLTLRPRVGGFDPRATRRSC